MSGIYIEHRTLSSPGMSVLANDLAQHLYTRRLQGKALILASEPFLLMRVVRKQWLHLIKVVERERAKTLSAPRIAELSYEVAHMQRMSFVAKPPSQDFKADVYFVNKKELDELSGDFHTIYISIATSDSLLVRVRDYIQESGLLVMYKIENT